jgi:plasmid stability protein
VDAISSDRVRLIIDTDEEVRLAVRLAATRQGVSISDAVNEILRKALGKEIEDAKKYTPKPQRKNTK